jgi:hypothetical protein
MEDLGEHSAAHVKALTFNSLEMLNKSVELVNNNIY